MAFSITLKRLPDSGVQRQFKVVSEDRPGKFPVRGTTAAPDPSEPPMPGRRFWWPQGVDTKTPGFSRNK